ncbi:hypothetical protein F0U62_10595 [Cystobacter fuscus]|uniref:hypothetical protein n=1 Tax=Cystobacter fuscus TaxID=43 RepID=UPI002B2F89A7|nr:hypothetical protein F0U62_10595 [Cystobacter fuscus]
MSAEELPEEWRGRRVGILDSLLQGRRYVLTRHALWYVTGIETADSLFPSIQGWLANTHLNGGAELAWREFLDWYQESRGEPLRYDWYVKPLQECQGDEERAALVLLELVAGYVEKHGVFARRGAGAMDEWILATYGPLPRAWGGRPVGLLDALLWLRQRMDQGHELSLLTGARSIDSLYCFTIGWVRNTLYNRQKDPSLASFWDWLRDVKKEFPGEGWHVKYLRDCQGDHMRAVRKFLDLAAEFKESR